jgi:homogentisate 1,2-dioxygenase
MYSCNTSMDKNTAYYSADGDILIVAQSGCLTITTELGKLCVAPKEICVIPRGIRYHVAVDGNSRGYYCEIFKGHFLLPELGPIGANGLANARDFKIPVAYYEDKTEDFFVISKFQGKFFRSKHKSSVFDTVAWHGNYVPFKYNLDDFNTIGTISYDHPDPSIFTVLTAATDEPG